MTSRNEVCPIRSKKTRDQFLKPQSTSLIFQGPFKSHLTSIFYSNSPMTHDDLAPRGMKRGPRVSALKLYFITVGN